MDEGHAVVRLPHDLLTWVTSLWRGASADLSTARMDLQPRSRSCRQGGPAHGEVSLPAHKVLWEHSPAPRGLGSPNLETDPSQDYWAWVGPGTPYEEASSWPGCMSPQCGGTMGAQVCLLVWRNHGGTGLADGACSCPHRERTAVSAARGYGASRGRATGASTANCWFISAATCSSH